MLRMAAASMAFPALEDHSLGVLVKFLNMKFVS